MKRQKMTARLQSSLVQVSFKLEQWINLQQDTSKPCFGFSELSCEGAHYNQLWNTELVTASNCGDTSIPS